MSPRTRQPLGQHFLADRHYISAIVDVIAPRAGEHMIEIGPGRGAITLPLLEAGVNLTVIELDPELASAMAARPEARQGQLRVEHMNALKLDVAAFNFGAPVRVVGNLPYGISTPLLFHLASQSDRIESMVFMLQREVVDRMCAAPDSHDYGRLSVALQVDFEMVNHFDVPPGAFAPPPRVYSAVVSMRPRPQPVPVSDRAVFDEMIRRAFGQRRKTLRNALGTFCDSDTLNAAGIDPQRRAETVSVAEYVRVANLLANR
ncbi:MAG: 16S rRNA (adenine(1518)-N(6)/adenine(1519)-N(6))-dimethyltransferase RsmA [Gammaproteobacteria bacterium]|nr:16S rRNA (adenine(1518)-N(6)/adenine(1519)-N(6))-dimethyltransferase RsmA [Gammaproteobacteria bacterium]